MDAKLVGVGFKPNAFYNFVTLVNILWSFHTNFHAWILDPFFPIFKSFSSLKRNRQIFIALHWLEKGIYYFCPSILYTYNVELECSQLEIE
jgi:hypothetical protein